MSSFVKSIEKFTIISYPYNKECDIVIYPSIDKLLNIIESKYELVHIAARRSKEISKTDHLQMPEVDYKCKKNIGRALEEITNNLLKTEKE